MDPEVRGDLNAARCLVYQWLSASLSVTDPGARASLRDLAFQERCVAAAEYLSRSVTDPEDGLAQGERSARTLILEPLIVAARADIGLVMAEFERVFGLLMSSECPPFETEYCRQAFSVYRAQQMADIAGYYRAFGLTPGTSQRRRVDHAAMELEFMAWLIIKEEAAYGGPHAGSDHAATCKEAQFSFFRDHLSWWIPAFAAGLRNRSESVAGDAPALDGSTSYYHGLADALGAFIAIERSILGVLRQEEPVAPLQVAESDCDSCDAVCDDLYPSNQAAEASMPRTPHAC